MTEAPFQLVIFDNDGVLVDSEPHANRVLAELLTAAGLSTSYEEAVAEFMGTSMRHVRAVAESRLGSPLPSNFEEEYHRRLFERLRRDLRPIPGLDEALRRVTIPRCVASSGGHERIRFTLELVGLWSLFRHAVFSAEDVERGKPAPDLFLHAARSLGVPPDRCAVIEDSPLGIEAANAAGMTSFGYTARTPPARLAAATGGLFAHMRELPAQLGLCDDRQVIDR